MQASDLDKPNQMLALSILVVVFIALILRVVRLEMTWAEKKLARIFYKFGWGT
jgi:hypothetical protein